jgi:hypothetical protein
MHGTSTIHYLKHHEIDKQQWDATVSAAVNKLIYPYSFYLDHLAPAWHALVGENYDWVLPITWKQKLGVKYVYQPPFIQQLGVFYKEGVEVPYALLTDELQKRYGFCEVQWNYDTPAIPGELQVKTGTNFILDLSNDHWVITTGYSKDLQRNIRRGNKFGLHYVQGTDVQFCIELYQQHYANRTPHVTQVHYDQFERLCNYLLEKNMVYCRQIVNKESQVLAVALLLFDGNRLYNMMNTTTSDGRKSEANYLLFDGIIKEFSSRNVILDFEGSDLPGVQAFYKNFGAVNQPYFHVKYNQLPAPLRWLKR